MTRDIEQRLRLFLFHDWVRQETDRLSHVPRDERLRRLEQEYDDNQGWDSRLEVRRLALTWSQVGQYSPPPNPAKSSDARYRGYAKEFGDESWELDALEPTVLGQLVRDEVDDLLDHDRWDAAVEREAAGSERLRRVAQRWGEVEDLVG
jgi:hypothetical protein